MEKNIAALMREDCKTIHVVFSPSVSSEVTPKEQRPKIRPVARSDSKNWEDNPFDAQPLPVSKVYTYVTDLDVSCGDLVVVVANNVYQVVTVVGVHDSVDIEPNSDIEFKWVVSKVDLTHHNKNIEQNKKITRAVAQAYKANLRRGFAQQVLLGMPEAQKSELENLIRGSKD